MAAGYGQLGNTDGGGNGDDDVEDDDDDNADPGDGDDQSYGHGHCAFSANTVHQQYATIIAVINSQIAVIIAIFTGIQRLQSFANRNRLLYYLTMRYI